MNVERSVLLQYQDEQRGISFRIERWFIAGDERIESMIKPALIWDAGGENEQVVILGRAEVRAVMKILAPFS